MKEWQDLLFLARMCTPDNVFVPLATMFAICQEDW